MPHRVTAIISYEEKEETLFLVLKRSVEDGGFWQYVRGTPEDGENHINALKREIYEETGLGDDDIELSPLPFFHYTWTKDDTTIYKEVFCARSKTQKITLSTEHTQYLWLSADEALEKLEKENNKKALQVLLSKKVKEKKSI